ncbi:MAG: D-glycero-beta-D-manno-heptose-7-phosphate kinase [Planctomycetota bacterium]|nr:D-glycero-beta-D-manno-heptose-7-phosphate kinase [Planctomycetota bacterium]
MRTKRLERVIEKLGHPRIVVIGDIILDHYIKGRVDRISPEAPIQVLRHISEEHRLGGAGNVAHNLATLEARTTLIGVIGDDEAGRTLRSLLKKHKIDDQFLLVDRIRRTTLKSRMIARNGQQILRVDYEDDGDIHDEVGLITKIRDCLENCDLVILSDYAKGVLTDKVIRATIERARELGCPVIVDPKGRHYKKYKGATTLTPNLLEAQTATGMQLLNDEERKVVGMKMIRDLDLDAMIITLSGDGMFVVDKHGEQHRVRAKPKNVFDVTGAGDTGIATMGLVLAAGFPYHTALSLANYAGGIVVGKVGTATITRTELLSIARSEEKISNISGRLRSVTNLIDILSKERDESTRLAVIVGSFNNLNATTLKMIRDCNQFADRIVALVTGDEDAAVVLEDIRSLDHVLTSKEPSEEIMQLDPDFIIFETEDLKLKAIVSGLRAEIRDFKQSP